MTNATATHLALIVTHWPDLIDALAARNTSTWPPAGLRHHLHTRDADEADWLAAHRYLDRSRDQLGETAAPIRLEVVDVMRETEQQLQYLAGTIAAAIQRPPVTAAPPGWILCDQMRRNKMAREDAADPRRWNWRGSACSGPDAARWLLARVNGEAGPFVRPLNTAEKHRIATAAATAADRIERALTLSRRSTPAGRPCPHCRGSLVVFGGDGQAAVVKCEDCGRTWTEKPAVA